MDASQSKKELDNFQGMVNYLKQYSSRLTQVAEPSEELPRNDTLWCWQSKHQEAFKAIKEELIKTPVLAYFNPNAEQVIKVDGSMNGFGAVLLQKDRPVIYVSRIMTLAETDCSNIERGLLIIFFWIGEVTSQHLWQHG